MRQLRELVAAPTSMSPRRDASEILTSAGWHPDRKVDASPQVESLQRDGYAVWMGLIRFLEQFSGLVLSFIRNGRPDTAWVDSARALQLADEATVRDYEARLKVALAPIGYANHDHLLLLMSEDGRFFGGYDDFLTELGGTPIEMVDAIIDGNPPALSDE